MEGDTPKVTGKQGDMTGMYKQTGPDKQTGKKGKRRCRNIFAKHRIACGITCVSMAVLVLIGSIIGTVYMATRSTSTPKTSPRPPNFLAFPVPNDSAENQSKDESVPAWSAALIGLGYITFILLGSTSLYLFTCARCLGHGDGCMATAASISERDILPKGVAIVFRDEPDLPQPAVVEEVAEHR